MPGRFDLSTTTVGELLDDPEARAIIDEVVPQLPSHPMIGFARSMPVEAVMAMTAGQFDPATAATLRAHRGPLRRRES